MDGDVRKLQARSNDSPTGGGARDIRLRPFRRWNPVVEQIISQPTKRRGILGSAVNWTEPSGAVQSAVIEWWRPTASRGGEGRLGRVHRVASWHVDPIAYKAAKRRGKKWFVRLVKDELGRVWADLIKPDGVAEVDDITKELLHEALDHRPATAGRVLATAAHEAEERIFEDATVSDRPTGHELAQVDRLTRDEDLDAVIARCENRTKGKAPAEVISRVRRLKRNYALVQALKQKFSYRCQLASCRFTFVTAKGHQYCEAAHVLPLHKRSNDLDVKENILILCSNHHKMLDRGAMVMVSPAEVQLDGKVVRLCGPGEA